MRYARIIFNALIAVLFLSCTHVQAHTVKILTLNTALLSIAGGTIAIGMKDDAARAARIAQTILAMAPQEQPDIICFQEAFNYAVVQNHLYKALKELYPHNYIDDRFGQGIAGVHSGLAIISKFPIEKKDNIEFTCWQGDGSLSRKGVFGVKLSVLGRPLYVFNTHLQAGRSDMTLYQFAGLRARFCQGHNNEKLSSDAIRFLQLVQAKEFIRRFVDSHDAPVIFCGDFNVWSEAIDEHGDIIAGDTEDFKNPLAGKRTLKYPKSINKWLQQYSFAEFTNEWPEDVTYVSYATIDIIFGPEADSCKIDGRPICGGTDWNNTPSHRLDYILNLNPARATVEPRVLNLFTKHDPAMTDHKGLLGFISLH